jgi:thiamine kinase
MPDHSQSRNMPPPALVTELIRTGQIMPDQGWTVLLGGRTNQIWKVEDPRGARVVKRYVRAAGTPLFRNDPPAELRVLAALRATGLAPRALCEAGTPADPVLVYVHQAGQVWREGPQRVARTLKALHEQPVTKDLTDLPAAPDGSDALAQQALAMLADLPVSQAARLPQPAPTQHVPPSRVRCLLHGDPVPDNLVCPADDPAAPPVLIDWQCPALGDPVLDLAIFLSPAMQQIARGRPLSADERRLFLRAYDDPATEQRLHALQPVLHWRMAAYCLWKMHQDRPDLAYGPALAAELAALQGLANQPIRPEKP